MLKGWGEHDKNMGGRGKGEALPKGKHMDPTPGTGGGVRVEGGVKFLTHPFKKKK